MSEQHKSKGISPGGLILAVFAGALGAGAGLHGIAGCGGNQPAEISVVPQGAVDTKVDRYRVPVGNAPVKGNPIAKVTIIEYSDFQCPFCSRVVDTLEQVEKAYPKDVRIAFKNNPLPFHPNAMPAAQAAYAAKLQGKFWEMHNQLFKNQQSLNKDSYDKWAKELGLDVAKFDKDMDADTTKQAIKDEQAEAAKYGARGTPSFFINGRPFSGAQPFDAFKKVVDEEIANADKAIKAGVAQNQVYDALTKAGKTSAPEPQRPPQQAANDDKTVYKVPVGSSPVAGPNDAEITIVEFSDFQCPFCSRVEATVEEVKKNYGNKVRIVWKNNPLPFHPNAMPAALAAAAAGEQGKFWQMHDTLFKNQQALDQASLEKYATELGLNMKKWKEAITSEKLKKGIADDMALAAQLGARGTPSFFINGHPLRGAQPYPTFKATIDEAMKFVDSLTAKGVKKSDLYAEIMKDAKEKADGGSPAQRQPGPSDATVYKALIGDAPVRGAKNAKVTIVMWSDFQCPFCGRVEPTVDQILKTYPNDVRVAFKQLPLPFHQNAHPAAEAALAAKEQGKFWEMHDVLFKNQQALDRASLEKYAAQIGLNVDKFKAALDSGKYKEKVDAEAKEGNAIGARGTPSFFINGKSLVGAQPFEQFKAKIDEELKSAEALAAKHHLKGGDALYAEIMKEAKTAPAAPAQAGPGEDTTVYKVDPGRGPSKGPATAPVQIVEFSDFQCPFCSRVEPTIKQVMDKYQGKVRITWRNYPLPFHQNAMPAAEAAMAANEQGKFWEMHDKLFANQQALDRASFEKYAQEIGLDVGKFKSALDSGAEKGAVNSDVQYANSLPGGGMGTPTFFINGRKIPGALPFEQFAKIIDEELKKKGVK